jgi:hypothetical protein
MIPGSVASHGPREVCHYPRVRFPIRRGLFAACLLASGCDKPAPPGPAANPTPSASTPPRAPSASAASANKPPAIEDLSPRGFYPPEKPSKPPTVAEWKGARESEVKNGKQLACEVKIVREWLRVSCRTTENKASQIQGLTLLEPKVRSADFYELVKPNTLASMVFPIRKATQVRIEFEWTDFKRILSVAWTPGAPRPIIYFDGSAPKDLSKPLCLAVCGIPYFPGRGTMPCPPTHDPTNGEDNGCACRAWSKGECVIDW